jgi:acetyl esterase/lipase
MFHKTSDQPRMIRVLTVILFLLVPGFVWADEAVFHPDITYATIDGVDLKLDVATPGAGGPYPLVLCVHGGAWCVGDKSRLDAYIKQLATHGYVAATINYRFAPKYKFPAQLDDARTALRFLKSHAAEYQIDPDHVAAAGESAGAQIALLMGMMSDDRKNAADISTKVQCVLNYYAPTDFSQWKVTPFHELLAQQIVHKSISQIMTDLFGTGDLTSPLMAAASPAHFVSADAPPIISFHGSFDPIVPYQQAELLHEALRKAGVKEKLVEVVGGHGHWTATVKADADRQAVEWLDQIFKNEPVHPPQLTKTDIPKMEASPKLRTTH